MLMVQEEHRPVTLAIPGIADEAFHAPGARYEGCRIEYAAEGDLIVLPPTGSGDFGNS